MIVIKKIKQFIDRYLPWPLSQAIGFLYGYSQKNIYFSQYGEDILLDSYFNSIGVHNGVYVDIGCFHPRWISNTYLLAKKGWTGYAIDLDEYKVKFYRLGRPKCEVSYGAIVPRETFVPEKEIAVYRFNILYSMIDTTLRSEAERISKSSGKPFSEQLVPAISVKDYFKNIQKINLLNIDIEGLDSLVLREIDLERHQPEAVVFEDNSKNELSGFAHTYLRSKGYTRLFTAGGSYCYVRDSGSKKFDN